MKKLVIEGVPNPKQQLFFDSEARYTAYGGARGGGKSWALRRKLVGLCLRYPGIKCLIVRRTYDELADNHVSPFLREYGSLISYSESEKMLSFYCGSTIKLGHCATDRDTMRYQGREFDIIAIDEATQLSEFQFKTLSACLRGVRDFPRRMYLTCNPGGVGHYWVKRLFVDRIYRDGERAEDYKFISALVYDNPALMRADPDYVRQLEALPEKLRTAWLYGRWDVFEGQFFPEFDPKRHVIKATDADKIEMRYFIALDYGLDMLAVLFMGYDREGNLYVLREKCQSGLTLSEASEAIVAFDTEKRAEYAVASPDLWNRRQDSGVSGFEIMMRNTGMPPMVRADNRRIPGWRALRNMLGAKNEGKLKISDSCTELIRCLPALIFDKKGTEDASGEPHEITHAPEALRYAVMSRLPQMETNEKCDFNFQRKKKNIFD